MWLGRAELTPVTHDDVTAVVTPRDNLSTPVPTSPQCASSCSHIALNSDADGGGLLLFIRVLAEQLLALRTGPCALAPDPNTVNLTFAGTIIDTLM